MKPNVQKLCLEVMSSLIHAIESYDEIFDVVDTLNILLESTPLMLPHTKNWNQILHKRTLNHKTIFMIYKNLIKELNDETKNVILKVLIEIKYDNSKKFSEKVEEIILYVKGGI